MPAASSGRSFGISPSPTSAEPPIFDSGDVELEMARHGERARDLRAASTSRAWTWP